MICIPKVWGWRKINRNFWKFKELIVGKIKRTYKGWSVEIRDNYFNKYDYDGIHDRWIEAYADLVDKMKDISNDIRKDVNKIVG